MVASVATARSLIPLLLYFGKETVYELSRNYQRNCLKSPAGDPGPYAIRGTAIYGTEIRFPKEPTDGDWYECTLGSPEDVRSDCSTSQHVCPVTVAMIRERAEGPARHRRSAPSLPGARAYGLAASRVRTTSVTPVQTRALYVQHFKEDVQASSSLSLPSESFEVLGRKKRSVIQSKSTCTRLRFRPSSLR
jgi:hypothetical protein